MLKLVNIKKDYIVDKDLKTTALKGISLSFGEKGFAAILGPSGCGKTTLLNIISGLDRYTKGDLIIDGKSTKEYKDRDWDNYRNKKIGIIFQSYNLIPHLSILENTELALTLSGISVKEKKERAMEALKQVGLENQAKKKPNQLSGGQQQRVAIARAIVSNPSIILADEPTGALDSETSTQVIDILHDISKEHLVIMVTHNEELAYKYADRIIRMNDGLVVDDSAPCDEDKKEEVVKTSAFNSKAPRPLTESEIQEAKRQEYYDEVNEEKNKKESKGKEKKEKKSKMSFFTAMKMSLKNLLTKKGRTFVTALASSFGIIGVGLVLAISGGFSDYVNRTETQTLAQFPISVEGYGLASASEMKSNQNTYDQHEEYPNSDDVTIVEPTQTMLHMNDLTSDYYESFLMGGTDSYGRKWAGLDKSLYASIQNNYSISANVIAKSKDDDGNDKYTSINTSSSSLISSLTSSSSSYWSELPGDEQYIESYYDLLPGGRFPQNKNEVVITVNKYNGISTNTLKALGINPNEFKNSDGTYKTINTETFNGMEFKLVPNDVYYTENEIDADSPTFYGIGLRGAGEGNQDNPYSFPKLLKFLSSIQSNDTNVDNNTLAKELINFFIPVENAKLSTSMTIKLTALLVQVKAQSDNTQKAKLIADFISSNKTQLEEELGGEINLINYQLPTYSKPKTNDQLKSSFVDDKSQTIKIVGILRKKESKTMGILGDGVYYLPSLTKDALMDAGKSNIAKKNDKDYFFINLESLAAQLDNIDLNDFINGNISSINFKDTFQAYNILSLDNTTKAPAKYSNISNYSNSRKSIGTDTSVGSITIYPVDFKTKEQLLAYLDLYNTTKKADGTELKSSEKIIYTDVSSLVSESLSTLVNVISIVLICFASISLVVSSVMIGIIIYVSVLERTKEIGILRSVGARKKDVGRLFKMESLAIGFIAGVLGVALTYLISIPINIGINLAFPGYAIGNIAALNPLYALLLIVISSLLTYVAGLSPSRSAAKRNPVKCLRTE